MTGIEAMHILEELIDLDEGLGLTNPQWERDKVRNWDFTCFHENGDNVTLDGEYTADQLEALAWWIRNHKDVKTLLNRGEVRQDLGSNPKD
jgi:hypothetical protein